MKTVSEKFQNDLEPINVWEDEGGYNPPASYEELYKFSETELPTNYQKFIHLSRYARWNEDKQRRELWHETVARYFDFFTKHLCF